VQKVLVDIALGESGVAGVCDEVGFSLVPRFASYDGTEISYRVRGGGPPVVCLPGGPGRAVEYLGDLGGLDGSHRLVLLDPRGVGRSADPADPATLRVDRLVDDVESLRVHLRLERMDLLAHSAGSVLATLYAAAYPQRLSRLILITPGLAAVGVHGSEEQLAAALERSAAEPWYPDALDAWQKIMAGELSLAAYRASRPFFYGRWDAAARSHANLGVAEHRTAARHGFFSEVSLDVPAIRTALTKLTAPVLLYGGEVDPMVTAAMLAEASPLLHEATVIVQPGAAHYPWVDDPAAFAAAVGSFLR
jgi:pimeloyl-ACP methyl ester carboxylesterase